MDNAPSPDDEHRVTIAPYLLPLAAGFVGGAMNALAGGGTFATLPSLLAIGLPANVANATSNVALLPGAATSAWAFRDELGPVGGISCRVLAAVTFAAGLVGSVLLVLTPSRAFDLIIPWLVLYAFVVLAFGKRASAWLRARATIGTRTLLVAQFLLGIYGGYFGGGVGLMTTATYGLLAGHTPRELFAPRTLMLAVANAAAAIVFVAAGVVRWAAALPMLVGAVAGGWAGARVGRALPAGAIRGWTLLVTGATTAVFFWRAYGHG
ncbi:sulfite exporter TauE/SafE family protein [uncultured Sphingomonas sp.]|uniref:sulfite exporter TauE/SafE family protein n=1 Tax=uncultured Sphingomonas sp. TaxID=158754 RepID=UPI0035CB9038